MKKSLLALAALTAFAGAASAQSTVTLFGIVDLAAQRVKNNNDTWNKLATDGINSSRLGFRGVEDLGGGLRAGFWLEAGLSPDVGAVGGGNGGFTANASGCAAANATGCGSTGGAMFNRRSTVSLLGGFGEIRLGRDYTPSFWNHTIFDVFGTNGLGSELNIYGLAGAGAGTLVRASNTLGYFLPALGGFYGQVQVALPEGVTGNKYEGLRFGYGAGPVNAAFGYGKTKKNNTMTSDVAEWNIGGSYNLGFMQIMAQYNKSTADVAPKSVKSWSVGLAVPVGAGTIQGSIGKTNVSLTSTTPSATQIAVGYQYDLSKRTALYGHYAQIKNDTGVAFVVASGAAGASGIKSSGAEVGLRHSF